MASEPFDPSKFFPFSNLAGRFPSIIQTRCGKAATMDDQAKALADLTAAIAGLRAKIDDLHPVVLDLQGWKPAIERSVDELRAEVGDLRGLLQDKGKSGRARRRLPFRHIHLLRHR